MNKYAILLMILCANANAQELELTEKETEQFIYAACAGASFVVANNTKGELNEFALYEAERFMAKVSEEIMLEMMLGIMEKFNSGELHLLDIANFARECSRLP